MEATGTSIRCFEFITTEKTNFLLHDF